MEAGRSLLSISRVVEPFDKILVEYVTILNPRKLHCNKTRINDFFNSLRYEGIIISVSPSNISFIIELDQNLNYVAKV